MQFILVTGCAGFIGFHLCNRLLKDGNIVIGIDNLNDYYDISLKEKRLSILKENENFKFYKMDFSKNDELYKIKENYEVIMHIGAQAGVRYSLINPLIYEESNLKGTLNLLELARVKNIKKFIFASSSSVYGNNKRIPFSENDSVEEPISLYAATKRSGELMCYTYSKLYSISCMCLRFFTVYGPYGRPDMAAYKFSNSILNNQVIELYNYGEMERDFTYVDDIINGVIKCLYINVKFEIINLGNSKPIKLKYFLSLIENNLGKKSKIKLMPIQKGEVQKTYADINKAKTLLNWEPKTSIEEGINRFVIWYKTYYK